MTQYNTLNVKLFNLQPNKLEPGIKNEIEVILRLSSKPKLALAISTSAPFFSKKIFIN